MLRRMFSRMAGVAVLFLWTIGARGDMISIVPASTDVTLGSSINLDIVAQDVNLGGYQLVLKFAPTLVTFTNASPDQFLGDASSDSFFTSALGLDTVEIVEVSFLSPAALVALQGISPGNSFRLATITFQASAVGLAEFTFDQTDLSDLFGSPVNAEFFGASVTIREEQTPPPPVTIPEPATWTLLAGVVLILFRLVPAKRCLAVGAKLHRGVRAAVDAEL